MVLPPRMACRDTSLRGFQADRMSKAFELETLKIRMADADLQWLDLHQRIQRALGALILDGALGAGVKLPATRTLAQSLGVARDTVENAYVQLHRDGFISRRKGSGSYVSATLSLIHI